MAANTSRSTARAGEARPRRLTAGARRSSILQAARRAFTETGDMNGTLELVSRRTMDGFFPGVSASQRQAR